MPGWPLNNFHNVLLLFASTFDYICSCTANETHMATAQTTKYRMVNSAGSRTQSERTSGSKIPSMKASPGVIHLEMGGDYESPTNSSKNTKDEATSNYLSNNLEKPRKMKWKEVDVPAWLQELNSFKEGDWKVLVNKRENGRTDWVSRSPIQTWA